MRKGPTPPPTTRMADRVRLATAADAEDLADVHVTTWQRAYRDVFPPEFLAGLDRHRRIQWWRRMIDDGGEVHVVGDQRVVGFCSAGRSEDAGWGEIFSIYVHPDHWRSGYGGELLVAGEEKLRAAGFDRALLWVLEGNDGARRFYERHGWVVGRPFRVEEIGGVQVTEVRYEKYLSGE